jgi:type II secretory pathway pseudopilin PulG
MRPTRRRSQSGYMLLVVLIMLALLMLALTALAPHIAGQIRREREAELMHRGQQYQRAIKRYFRKFGRYPARIEDLESTSNIRFLRKRYTDPITGKDDWKLIHPGEAKITPKIFGQQAGAVGAPIGAPLGSPLGGAVGAASAPGGAVGTQPTGIGSINPAAAAAAASAFGGAAGAQTLTRPVLGGGPIIGVSPGSEQQSLKEMDGKDHYNEWEFVYDPRFDVANAAGALGGAGLRPGQAGTPIQTGAPGQPGTGTMTNPAVTPAPMKP